MSVMLFSTATPVKVVAKAVVVNAQVAAGQTKAGNEQVTPTGLASSQLNGPLPLLRYPVDIANVTSPIDGYAIDGRVMYRFTVNQYQLIELCSLNINPQLNTKVNIVCVQYEVIPNTPDLVVSMLVGYDNARNVTCGGAGTSDGSYHRDQSHELQHQQFEDNLKSMKISYNRHAVLQIFNWHIDEANHNSKLTTPLLLLLKAGVKVLSYREGDCNYRLPAAHLGDEREAYVGLSSLFIEVPVSDLQAGIDALSAFTPTPWYSS